MADLSQNSRLARISTSLSDDSFIISALDGEEIISGLFQYDLQLMSDNHNVEHSQLLGKEVTITIHASGEDKQRYIHGYVNSLRLLDINDDSLRGYHISVVPGLWFSTLNSKNRIFQNKTAEAIITEVLNVHSSVIKFDFSTSTTFLNREYCVQFDETDFEFVSRLLAEEGISYYFEHSESEHKIIFVDDSQGFFDLGLDSLDYDGGGSQPTKNSIHSWQRNYSYHTGAVELTDYNEFSPSNNYKTKISTASSLNSVSGYSRQQYGHYRLEADGDSKHAFKSADNNTRSTAIMVADESRFDVAIATSDVGQLAVGGKFSIDHSISSEQGSYTISRLTTSLREGNGQETFFQNEFECLPADKPIRPVWLGAPKKIEYPQVAKVEEVKATESDSSSDTFTQLKVKFPWNGEQTSCWVRVAQAFAGKNWGANFVPRIGQEVIVHYLNGDPSRPIITGAVYNGANEGPNYTATQSGWKTLYDSSEFNELRFDDKPGQEEIYMEAGKDHNWVVHNDQTGVVENNQTLEVEQARTITVNRGDESITVRRGDRTVDVDKGDYSTTVGTGHHNTTVSKGNQANTVSKGNKTTTVNAGNYSTKLSKGNYSVKCSAGQYSVSAKSGVKIESVTGIELKCGSSSIKMTPSGITIKGIILNCKGDAKAEVKAGGMLTLKGGVTMIN